MNVCGKALPPKAATLLGANSLLLVVCIPFLLTLHAIPPGNSPSRFSETLIRLAAIGLFCQVVFYYSELYNLQIARKIGTQIWRILGAVGMVMLILAGILCAFPALSPGRDALLGLPLASIAVLLLTRHLAIPARRTNVTVIGSEGSCRSLEESLESYPEWNMEVVGSFRSEDLSQLPGPGDIDRIILCADASLDAVALEPLVQLKMRGVRVERAADFYERSTGRVHIDEVNPEWFVFSNGFENSRRKLLVKRCFDLLASSILLALVLPLILLAAAAIMIEGKGSIFYKQKRVGLYGKKFDIFKLRTMIPAPPDATPQWAANQDKRITWLGRILRTFRIDELPQLVNVLKGDMSFVGPRPEQPYFCDLLASEIPFYHQRHSIPPGLTGWAQVRYMYGASIEESRRKLEFDLFYVKNLSLWLDLAIAFETLKVVLVGKGAK